MVSDNFMIVDSIGRLASWNDSLLNVGSSFGSEEKFDCHWVMMIENELFTFGWTLLVKIVHHDLN